MHNTFVRQVFGLCVVGLLITAPAFGQDYVLPYNKPPETPPEFWAAVKLEMNLGNFKPAAARLKSFWDKLSALGEDEQRDLLLRLYDQDGMSFFIKLTNNATVRGVTAKDPKDQKDRAIADMLLNKVSALVEARLGDPERIKFFIANLSKTPQERSYALTQLRQAGARAVPYMVAVLRDADRSMEHPPVLMALLRMDSDIGPPLLAAFDARDQVLRAKLVSLFHQRADDRVIPYLWYLRALPEQPDAKRKDADFAPAALRNHANDTLSKFLRVPVKDLGDSRFPLTAESERYYQGKYELASDQNQLWRWDAAADGLKSITATDAAGKESALLTKAQVGRYLGPYWARKTLEIFPAHRPAQVLYVSFMLENAVERGGLDQGLDKSPELSALLASTGSSLLEDVLTHALADGRTAVVLGAVRALGPSGDWKLVRGDNKGVPPLMRALSYPDRRVQLAAADAILQIPSSSPFPGNSRVIEVLRRALATDTKARALIGFPNQADGLKLGTTIQGWGLESAVVTNGRELLRLATESGDIEVIFLHPELPDPGLPYLLSQLRASPDTAGLPIVIMTPRELEKTTRGYETRFPRVKVLAPPPLSPDVLKAELGAFLSDRFRTPLNDAERRVQAQLALSWLVRVARGEAGGYDLKPADAAILRALTADDLAAGAAAAAAARPGRQPQGALAEVVLNTTRKPEIRAEVARGLRSHLQKNGIFLKPEQIDGLVKSAGIVDDPASMEEANKLDPKLREELARLAAYLVQADGQLAGKRLRGFDPGAAPAPKPPMPEKEVPKEDK